MPHVHVVLGKKSKKQFHHGYTYFILTVCSQQSLTLGPPEHLHVAVLSAQCLALPVSVPQGALSPALGVQSSRPNHGYYLVSYE